MIIRRYNKAILYSSPTMDGYTYNYWLSASGVRSEFKTWYPLWLVTILPITLVFLPVSIWVYVAGMKDAAVEAKKWIPNRRRVGCQHLKWFTKESSGKLVELVSSFLKASKHVPVWALTGTKTHRIFIALIRGGRESLGLSKLYLIIRADEYDTILDAFAYKQFISPYENQKRLELDSVTRKFLAQLRAMLINQVNAIPDPQLISLQSERSDNDDAAESLKQLKAIVRDSKPHDFLDKLFWTIVDIPIGARMTKPAVRNYTMDRILFRQMFRFFSGILVLGLIYVVIAWVFGL